MNVPGNCLIGVDVHFPAVLQPGDFVAAIVYIEVGEFVTLGKLVFKSRNPALGILTQKSLVIPLREGEREHLVHRVAIVIHVIGQAFGYLERVRFGHGPGIRFPEIEKDPAVTDHLRWLRSWMPGKRIKCVNEYCVVVGIVA